MKIQGGLKKRILLVLVPLIGTFSLALTPTSLKIVGLELSYCEEFLALFDEAADHDEAIVSSIIDGDILTVIRNKYLNLIEVIRLIGIGSPDSSHRDQSIERFGSQAADFARLLLEDRRVLLTYDELPRDTYGRILASVWLPATCKGETRYVLFNLLGVANGYAHAYTRHPFNDYYMEIFIKTGRQAKLQRTGLWVKEDFANIPAEPFFNPIVYITNTGEKYHQITASICLKAEFRLDCRKLFTLA